MEFLDGDELFLHYLQIVLNIKRSNLLEVAPFNIICDTSCFLGIYPKKLFSNLLFAFGLNLRMAFSLI